MVFSFQSDGGSLYIPLQFKELKPLDVGHRILALNANYEFFLEKLIEQQLFVNYHINRIHHVDELQHLAMARCPPPNSRSF